MLWSTVSKAFEKSRKIPQENRPSSIALWILSVIRRVSCIVQCFSLKVDIQNVVFINKINWSVMHKFFQYFVESRKQRDGSIIVHASH